MTRVVFAASASLDEAAILNDLSMRAGWQVAVKFRALFRGLYERLAVHPAIGAPRPVLG